VLIDRQIDKPVIEALDGLVDRFGTEFFGGRASQCSSSEDTQVARRKMFKWRWNLQPCSPPADSGPGGLYRSRTSR
jgi:hypothetical protein